MKKKILVMSIPHTGTVFTTDYLEHVIQLRYFEDSYWKFSINPSKHIFTQVHISEDQRKETKMLQSKKHDIMSYSKNNCKIIIPLRHPIDNAISYITRYKSIDYLADNWRIMIKLSSEYDVFWLDIDIAKAKRRNMMLQLNKFIKCDSIDKIKFYRYVDKWKPANVYKGDSNPIKDAYINHGILPIGHNFDSLDFAVRWYQEKKFRLEQQYSKPM